MTFNLLHGGPGSGLSGDGERLEARLAVAVEELRRLAPDIVALQEASVGRGRGNVAARVAAALGLAYTHAPATSRVFKFPLLDNLIVRAINFAEGPAILSRFPIVSHEIYDLPRCVRFLDPRVALRAVLATPAGELVVISTHTARDACQTRRLAAIVREGAGALPSLVMGDFNAAETAPWIEELVQGDGFVDLFRAANPAARGATVWQRVDAPTRMAVRRVDYVFLVPGRTFTGRVSDSRIVLDTPRRLSDGGTLWPSDHYGVLADVRLVPRATAR